MVSSFPKHEPREAPRKMKTQHVYLESTLLLSPDFSSFSLNGAIGNTCPGGAAPILPSCLLSSVHWLRVSPTNRCFPSEQLSCHNWSRSQRLNFAARGQRSNTAALDPLGNWAYQMFNIIGAYLPKIVIECSQQFKINLTRMGLKAPTLDHVCSMDREVNINSIKHVYFLQKENTCNSEDWPHLLQFWVSFPFVRKITTCIWKQSLKRSH